MSIEYLTKELPLDDKLEAEVQKLAAEGWELVPGFVPFATYNLQRHTMASVGGLLIDESKIQVIRSDGTVRERE
jgi:hypothetical protein